MQSEGRQKAVGGGANDSLSKKGLSRFSPGTRHSRAQPARTTVQCLFRVQQRVWQDRQTMIVDEADE